MTLPTRILLTLAALALGVPLFALSEPSVEELEQNRKKLEQWKQEPEQIGRLRRDARAYLALPRERREQILQLDQDLYGKSSAVQNRLGNVMKRYNDWLAALPEEARRSVLDEPDKAKRLALIRSLRDLDFAKTQPQAVRTKIDAADGQARSDFIKALRRDERRRRQEWQVAQRFWNDLENKKPLESKVSDLPREVQAYVKEYLDLFLSREERDRLDKSQGQWPQFMMTLVELADKHPPALPGSRGPKTIAELPGDVKGRLFPKGGIGKLKITEGNWPELGTQLARIANKRKEGVLHYEFLAHNSKCLSEPMQKFVKEELFNVMTKDEVKRYFAAEGKWPDYPQAIQELAQAHDLQPPWLTLPGPRERWDAYRTPRLAD